MTSRPWATLLTIFSIVLTLAAAATAQDLPKVAIITTGGTIAERTDPKTGDAVPAVSGKDLIASVPGLAKIADVTVYEYANIDSSQMNPELWAGLSRTVDQVLAEPDVVGAVVTHGTDTMAEGAYFLDVTLETKKPVVFTGAMNAASSLEKDGPSNLLDAVVQVTSKNARDWGVTVTLNRYVNSARDVRKIQTTNLQTFESGEKGYLGYVFGGRVIRINERSHRIRIPLPAKLPTELPKVVYLQTYAGDDGDLVRHAVEAGARGLVIDGVGSGNVDARVYAAVQSALAKGVPVVVTSRVYWGAVEPIYGDKGGGATLQKAGALLAGSITGPKARLLLILALLKHGDDKAQIEAVFSQLRGSAD